MRKILSLRLIVFLALLPVAWLLFREGKRYPMMYPSIEGMTDDYYEINNGKCTVV